MFTHLTYLKKSVAALTFLAIWSTGLSADIGPLKAVVDTGYSDGWEASLKNGTYWLENQHEAGAIRYYYTGYKPADDGSRDISVKVQLQTDDPQARVGLLYGFDDQTRSYYLIMLGPEGQFEVVRRDASGFNLRMSSSTDVDPQDFNEIRIQEKGKEISLSVNGRNLGGFGNDTVGKGAVGIVAAGMGRFGFTDYREQTAPQTSAKPAKQPWGKTATTKQALRGKQKHVIRDEFGFEKPMDALTLTLPKGWDVKGAVQWYGKSSCSMEAITPKFHFMATAPDGKQWVEFIPGGTWNWSTNYNMMPQLAQSDPGGCEIRPITDMQTFVNEYIPIIRPNARIDSMRPRPDHARDALGDVVNSMRQQAPTMHMRPEAMEVRLSYTANGNTVHELLIPVVLFMDQQGVDFQGGMNAVLTMAIALGTITTATVDGEADEGLMDLIGDSMQPNPDYQARLDRHYRDAAQMMAQANARQLAANRAYRASMRNNSSSVAQTNSDILDIQMKGYQNRSAMQDAGQARSVDMIHERQPWQNTNGQTIYMPQEYQRVYQLPNDVYAGTNDAFFNPINGTQLAPAGY